MAGITLAEAEAKLAEYRAAESEALKSQELGVRDRKVVRADLVAIRDGIQYWDGKVKELSRTSQGIRRRRVIPC